MSVDDGHVPETREDDRQRRPPPGRDPLPIGPTETQTTDGEKDGSIDVRQHAHGSTEITLKRAAMAAATAFLSINLFTGAPLLALLLGSQVSDETILSMKAVTVVLVVFAVLAVSFGFALTWLSNSYDALIGRPVGERRSAWLRDVSARGFMSSRVGETLRERIVILSVYVAVIGLLVWFFFFAHASL